MTCSLCDKIALRMVGKRGFCKNHNAEAFDAAAKESRNSQSKRGLNEALHWDVAISQKELDSLA